MEKNKYSMIWRIQYTDNLNSVLDELRAIPTVLTCSPYQNLSKNREVITIKILTPNPAILAFTAVRQVAISKIQQLQSVEMLTKTVTNIY